LAGGRIECLVEEEATLSTAHLHAVPAPEGLVELYAESPLPTRRGPLRAMVFREKATGKDEQFFRFTVAKSLAQLGEADVLYVLIAAVSDDAYMSRHIGNIGLKALSGKSLEDFGGYVYGEGSSVIGGAELMMPVDALASSERKAGRFQAATAYLKWLRTERPDLYRSVNYRRKSRKAAPAR